MSREEYLKEKLSGFYRNNPCIHINVSFAKTRMEMKNVPVKLVGVYRHIFQVEEERNGKTERYSFQYGDLLAGIVQIAELPMECRSLIQK